MNQLKYLATDIYTVAWREIRHYLRQKPRIIANIVQPLVWLVLMGSMMSGLVAGSELQNIAGEAESYLDFMTPGIMIMTAMFGGIFGGISIIWDRKLGYLDKMLSTPIKRASIPLGKIASTVFIVIMQIIILILIALFMGVTFKTGILGILIIMVFAIFFCSIMASISLGIASVVKSHETLFSIINLIMMPLIFTSTAIFPLEAMPPWLSIIARLNPVSYAVAPIRSLTIEGWNITELLTGGLILSAFAILAITLTIRQFNKTIT